MSAGRKKRKREKTVAMWFILSWKNCEKKILEQKPYLLFEIRDANGNVVSRYKEEGKKGLNQSVWNYRMESTSPVQLKHDDPGRYGSPDWGALVLPGTYSVTIHKMQNGALTKTSWANQI